MSELIDKDEILKKAVTIPGPSGRSVFSVVFTDDVLNAKPIEPTTKNDLGVNCVARQDVERYIEGFINEYTPTEELEFINLELDGLKHLPPATPQEPRWIPVSERLPEERVYEDGHTEPSERVLVQLTNGEMHVSRYWTQWVCDSPWIDILYLYINKVVAWMPLPKQYDPQESEG